MSTILESENCDPSSYKTWYAKVRFRDNVVLDVSIKKIKTKEGKSFTPTSVEDFDPQEIYSVKTAKFDSEGKGQRYYAFIGKMAASLEELNDDAKRIRWPTRWPIELDDEPNNTSQDETSMTTAQPINLQRSKAVARINKRKKQADNMMQRFLNTSVLQATTSQELNRENINAGPRSAPACTCHRDGFTLDNVNQLLDERDRRWEAKIQQIIGETVASVMTAQFSKFDEKLSKCNINSSVNVEEWIQKLP